MLILTRRLSESLMIEDDIKVTVLGVQGHQVRLGIEAPKTTSVHREEIYQRIQAQQKPPSAGMSNTSKSNEQVGFNTHENLSRRK